MPNLGVLRKPCDRVVLPFEDSAGHARIVVCSYGVKHACEAEIHQANTIPHEGLVQCQSDLRPCSEEANGMGIYLERPQELDHISRLGRVFFLVLLPFGGNTPVKGIMGESHAMLRLESTIVDLLEVLDVDCRVVVMEAKKWLIT